MDILPIRVAFSILILISIKINHVNFKFLLLMTNVYCHVNFKVQQSCQPQILTFLSNSSSCSYVNQIQSIFEYNLSLLTAQVTSSYPRTACACQFVLVFGQAASSCPRTTCTCQFAVVFGQVASSYPRAACTYPFGIRRVANSRPRTARAFYFVFCLPSN